MHFGRGDLPTERNEELSLISCLNTYETEIKHLFLLGDVFDEYIEYRHLVPKGLVRFQGFLARWTDKGIPVTYLKGNHDPWHIDYFSSELGVTVFDGPINEPLFGNNVYMHHGDVVGSRIPFYSLLKHLLRHPIPVQLYRSVLPGDAGFGLARWVNSRLHTEELNMRAVEALRQYAQQALAVEERDYVILGHSHYPERFDWPEGTYINTGSWRFNRTFVCLSEQGMNLMRWTGEKARIWQPEDASRKKLSVTMQ